VQFLFLASAFRFCAGYGIGVWKAPFFREAFPTFTSEFSVANAFIISGGGIMSSILGGMISDKFSPQDQRVQVRARNSFARQIPSGRLMLAAHRHATDVLLPSLGLRVEG
jgi:hypothetical protein